ncbi:hypothetical protein [Actinoplanes auranticolor]|uniref:Uncharacterized protein n=1 Tax=Actinoplanes auranticolor TaxID=47988 RepID=A0A919SHG8_9ACTN|nr:hypothetical protein [Actinoplanes auranticolor]GIM71826.1 hypothetical protein Aau02nite_47910 [Actinoplanes auranticolor]
MQHRQESAARAVEARGGHQGAGEALPVAACGSHSDNSAGPAAAGPHSAHAGERFLDMRMAEAYTPALPEDGGSDVYRCQMIDPGLTKTVFLTGTRFAPENVAIAHHAVVWAVPPGGAAAVREQDAKTPGLGWRCSGETGVAGAEVEEGTRRVCCGAR